MKHTLILLLVITGFVATSQNCSVNADVDKTICANQTFSLNGSIAGLEGSTGSLWTQISGPSCTITSPTSLRTTVTNFSAGTYVFRLSTYCQDGNPSFDQVTFTVRPITVARAGRDTTYCPGSYFLTANAAGSGETGQWTWIGSSSSIGITGSSSTPTTAISVSTGPASSPSYRSFIWKMTNSNGCVSRDTVVVRNRGAVSPVNAGPDQTLSNCYIGDRFFDLSPSFGGYNIDGQRGIWKFVSGPNVPTFTADSMRYLSTGGSLRVTASQDGIIPGTYVFRWQVSGPCVSGSDLITIIIPTGIGSPSGSSISTASVVCLGNTAPIFASSTPTALGTNEVGLWIVTGPSSVTITSPNTHTTNLLNVGTSTLGTYTVSRLVTNTLTGCSNNGDLTKQIRVLDSTTIRPAVLTIPSRDTVLACGILEPEVSFTATGTYDFAGIDALYLSGGAYPPGTDFGLITSTGYLTPPVSTTTLTFPASGEYLVSYNLYQSIGSACTGVTSHQVTATRRITVSGSPTAANAGSAQNLACNVVSTNLNGNDPTPDVGTWTQVSGPNTANIVNPLLRNTTINGLVPGVYKFRWNVRNGYNCTSIPSDVLVYVSGGPLPAANAGPDQTVCANTPVQLSGSLPTLGATGTWSVSPSAGVSFSDVNSQTPTVNGLSASTVYTFTWRISNACGSVNDNVLVTTGPVTGPSVADAGTDICLASGSTSTTLNAANPTFGSGTWTQASGPNTASITSPTVRNTTVTGLINGTYRFVWTIAVSGCTSTTDTVLVTISAAASTADAGADQNSICGTSTNLAAANPAIGMGTWTQVSGPNTATIASVNSHTSAVSGLLTGFYTFRWTVSNGGCSSNDDDVDIVITNPPAAANAGADTSICGTSGATTYVPIRATPATGYWTMTTYNGGSGFSPGGYSANASPSNTVYIINNSVGTNPFQSNGPVVVRWTATPGTGCPLSYDEKTIRYTRSPSLANTYPQAICSSSSAVTTTANIQTASRVAGTWSFVSGPNTPTVSTTDSVTARVTGLTLGNYVFRFTSRDCPSSVDLQLTNGVAPTAQARDSTYCAFDGDPSDPSGGWGVSVLGSYSNYSASQYWQVLDVNPPSFPYYIGDSTTRNLYLSLFSADTVQFTLKYTVIDNCGGSSADTVLIKLYPLLDISAAISVDFATVCSAPYDNVLRVVSSYTADLYNFVGTSFNWNQVTGPRGYYYDGDDSTSYVSTLKDLPTGYYEFSYITRRGECSNGPAPQLVDFTVYSPGTAGGDKTVCVVSDIIILDGVSGSTDTTASGQGWSLVSGPNVPVFTDAHNPNTTVTNIALGTYVFRWTESGGVCGAGITDDVTVQVLGDYTAGPDQTLCMLFTSAAMAASTITAGSGTWTQESGPTSASFANINDPRTLVSGLASGTYRFRWTWTSATCNSFDEVLVTLNSTCPLPIELVSFDVSCKNNHRLMTWQTASETNNNHFVIQASSDGVTWVDVVKVKAVGNSSQLSNYDYEDDSNTNHNYYRLKQVDEDGHYSHSHIVYAENCQAAKSITIYPNPSKGVIYVSQNYGAIRLTITDVLGRKLLEEEGNVREMDLTTLSAGTYVVNVSDVNGNRLQSQKMVLMH